jgi:hypothetical protein
MNLLEGRDATCPHCWETINLTLDLSVPTTDGEITEFSVESAG